MNDTVFVALCKGAEQSDIWAFLLSIGGYEGLDGALYFIPENGYRVMKVIPPMEPPKIVNGKLPESDVLIELM